MEAKTVCAHCGVTNEGRPLACESCGEDPRVQGRYRLEGELGRGGSGVTWRARREPGGDPVCLKELRWASMGSLDDERRFAREGQLLEGLDHPAIPKHHGAFAWGEGRSHALFIAQELVVGDNLEVERRARGYTFEETLEAGAELADVLAYLHERSPPVVHRDIKPSNVMRRVDGKLVLIDFGAARVGGLGNPQVSVAGTFGYMAPEQIRGEAGPSVDIYGLGMTLGVLCAGGAPEDLLDGMNRPDFGRIVGLRADLRQLLESMCAIDATQRPTAVAVARRCRQMVSGPPRAIAAKQSVVTSRPEPARKKDGRALVVVFGAICVIGGTAATMLTMGGSSPPSIELSARVEVIAEPMVAMAARAARVTEEVAALAEAPVVTPVDAFQESLAGCGRGDGNACSEVATAYSQGRGVAASRIETRKYFGKACDLGNMEGCASYGHMLLKGDGGPTDWAAALPPLERACASGSDDPCISVGAIYAGGESGAKADRPKALGIFEGLCAKGVRPACENIDAMVGNNWGLPASGAFRIEALTRLCDGKSGAACLRLGDAYARGSGVKKDATRAREVYTRGCDFGAKPACEKMR